ncbi:maleylpyruvate isomerase family mycothiol-dependent enzyme [Actinoplanes sp. NPDC051861]|uniref:maleylpyruvate isomerase family mycothiol-dependent enzyme n=1 Tax=Actinoplanes sp. NPDC051861 TaxID=3155170 RepID=UPI0034308A84
MTADHETVSQLIGAWAVDACSPEEAHLVQGHLPGCADCAGEARTLRATAEELLFAPPAGLLARLRSEMPVRRRPAFKTPGYAKPYAAQVAALDLMLSDLATDDWRQVAAYEQLSVHDLLAHLIAVDGMVADALGVPGSLPVRPDMDAEARTSAVVAAEQSRPVSDTLRTWRDQADAVCRALPRRPDTSTTVTLGFTMPVPDALLARAFETWIHAEDIAGVTSSPSITPLPEHLNPMADLAVRMLPRVTSHRLPEASGRQIRLLLTGPGGGTWTVPLGEPAGFDTDAEVSVDVVEFCRLVGDRRDPAVIPAEVSGDERLAREWLSVVPALAPYP